MYYHMMFRKNPFRFTILSTYRLLRNFLDLYILPAISIDLNGNKLTDTENRCHLLRYTILSCMLCVFCLIIYLSFEVYI